MMAFTPNTLPKFCAWDDSAPEGQRELDT